MSGKRSISLMSCLVSFLIIVIHAYVLEANRQEYNLIVAGIQMNNSTFLWSDLSILFWFLNSLWIQFKMIVFLVLAILGELSILLHNTQPNSSLKPLQIVQVSSLFDHYSIASTIIKPQRVNSSFTSQQHNSTNSCSCIPYSLFPSWPKCWFSTSRWGVRKEQQVCSKVDEDSLSQTLQQRKEMLSTARSLLSQPIHKLRLS